MSARKILYQARDVWRGRRWQRLTEEIDGLLSQPGIADTALAEAAFVRLQADYAERPEYGYDRKSLAERASSRMAAILEHVERSDTRLATLDVATGDGTIGAMFAAAGFDAAICDMVDWRAEAAKALPFEIADCCQSLPYGDARFDIVSSFNSFEHMTDPRTALAEIVRVTKPGGTIYLDFGPLYASPWGLHAYRSLRMPYPQFLFSPEFIDARLTETGIDDLGAKRLELQFVNGWLVPQYQEAFAHPELETLQLHVSRDTDSLAMVRRHPECFRGRGLSFDHVTQSHIHAVFRKRG